MKASELRIGNIVEWWSDGNRKMWMEVSPPGINSLSKGRVDYRPIPLTEEWLLKFGWNKVNIGAGDIEFELTRSSGIFKFGYSSSSLYKYYVRDGGSYHFIAGDLHYVHTFQNLYFALTGEELIIK